MLKAGGKDGREVYDAHREEVVCSSLINVGMLNMTVASTEFCGSESWMLTTS